MLKLYGVIIFIFLMCMLSLLIIDLVAGVGFADALYSVGKSLWIIKPEEYTIIVILFLLITGQQIAIHLKNRDGN